VTQIYYNKIINNKGVITMEGYECIYFCQGCYNKHEDNIYRIFIAHEVYRIIDGKCKHCGNNNLQPMLLTDNDFDAILKVSEDPDFFLEMEQLKKNLSSVLNDEEFYTIIANSCDKDFVLAMSELKKKDIVDFNLKMAQFKKTVKSQKQAKKAEEESIPRPQSNIPKCPTCGSPDIKKISATKRWVGVGLFGLASSNIGKSMQCNNCGYKW
jgi:hypothetical protein